MTTMTTAIALASVLRPTAAADVVAAAAAAVAAAAVDDAVGVAFVSVVFVTVGISAAGVGTILTFQSRTLAMALLDRPPTVVVPRRPSPPYVPGHR